MLVSKRKQFLSIRNWCSCFLWSISTTSTKLCEEGDWGDDDDDVQWFNVHLKAD